MVDGKQKDTHPQDSFPEKEYAAISDKADELDVVGKEEEAIGELKKGLVLAESCGDEAFRLCFLGEIAHYQKDHKKSLELEHQAAFLRPDSFLILRNVGVQLSILGRHEEALEWFDRALEVNPKDFHSLRQKGVSLGKLGKYDETLEWFDRALEVNPGDYLSLKGKGVSLGNMGHEEEALEWLNRALQINPDYLLSLRERAYILHKLGRTEEAKNDVKKVLEIQPQLKNSLYLDQITAQEERKRAEIKARERKIRMDAWRRLSARAAHRIGNQLFAARSALKSLEKQTDPALKEATGDLHEALNQIQRLNHQFKKFSAKEELRLEDVSVENLVETVIRRYQKQAEEKNIKCRMLAETVKTWPLDRSMMEETLGELMENALHHTPAGGSITIEANQKEQQGKPHLFLIVENTGEGIENQYKERIFEAFFTTRSEGTGLGLAIVKKFIELHKGRIHETGIPGKSARFEILLPRPEPEEVSKA